MKVLHVIHGYPMRYNAGSEVYTQTLARAQSAGHEVHVFTREEDSFAPEHRLRREEDGAVTVHIVNAPHGRDRYRHVGIDQRFAELLDALQPSIVHVGHLNHLSTSLLAEAAAREIPMVFTLHDYWLMCPRGQLMQMHPVDPQQVWPVCDGQEDRKCAERCYARYVSGAPEERDRDVDHWTDWVGRRMSHVRQVAELVDLFVAPSRYLLGRFSRDFGLPERKLVHLDYGFDLARLGDRQRPPGEPFTFGYIGTHIPAKGIHQLIEAFALVPGDARLRIWGRPRGQDTEALVARAQHLVDAGRLEWLPEYRNEQIVPEVFNRVDAIVVPSLWVENSPLVIHEAQQARVPVITADVGGMAELVHHEVNGLLFGHRDVASLAVQMRRLAANRDLASQLGARGYLNSESGDIPSIEDHVASLDALYAQTLSRRDSTRLPALPGPWRITFDTNPDTCNLQCIMCEEHSPHSTLQLTRKSADKPRRVMPIALVRRIIEEAVPHGLREVIPSTMGEPLLYEDFDEILALCKQHGLKLNLTTNGTFPRRNAREWAERIVPVTSDVKISWNGATRETHETVMRGASWDRMLENARTFIGVRDAHAAHGGNRCRVTFQLTFLETNVAELPDMVRLAVELGVDRVKGHHLWAHFEEIKSLSMRRSPEAIRRWNEAVLAARAAAGERTLPNGKHITLENVFLLDAEATADLAPGGQCPFLGQEAWVSAEGRFDPCCAPDAQRRTLGDFGSLRDRGFMEVWKGESYRRLVTTYRNRPLCLGCNMRKPLEVR